MESAADPVAPMIAWARQIIELCLTRMLAPRSYVPTLGCTRSVGRIVAMGCAGAKPIGQGTPGSGLNVNDGQYQPA
eukprot:2346396-Amphidinium_carterae.1